MSPSMEMEMNSRSNVTNYHPSSNRHHVRNLWPPVGGGLPGGKPVEPALGSSAPLLQKPPDYYSQSTSYVQTRPVPKVTDAAYENNKNYYYKSSQVRPNPTAAIDVVVPPAEYSHYYGQEPKYIQHPATAINHWYPPPAQVQTSQFYIPVPTTMFNEVSGLM